MGRTPRDCTPAPHDSVRVGPPDAAGGAEREPRGDLDMKLRSVRAAARHEFPTADVEQMLEEIERGRGAEREGSR